VDKTLKEFKAV